MKKLGMVAYVCYSGDPMEMWEEETGKRLNWKLMVQLSLRAQADGRNSK